MKIIRKAKEYFLFIRPWAFFGISAVCLSSSLIAAKSIGVTYVLCEVLIGAVSCGLLASAAHALNNIYDHSIDKINKPFRAIPSGKISLTEAWIVTLFLYLLSTWLALSLSNIFIIIFSLMAFFAWAYSHPWLRLKGKGIYANLAMAIPRGLLIVLAGWAIVAPITEMTVWVIGGISALYLIGASNTKDLADSKGDNKAGCKTLVVLYGVEWVSKFSLPFLTLPFLIIPIAVGFGIFVTSSFPLTLLSIYGGYIYYLMRHKRRLTRIEGNHISWMHTYVVYMIFHIGMTISFLLG